MAHCVISAVFDTDADQMVPACVVPAGDGAVMVTPECRRCRRGPLIFKRSESVGLKHAARGLCGACYQWAFSNNALDDYPRHNAEPMDRATVIRRYMELRDQDLTMIEIARRIGINRTALYKVLERDRRGPERLSEADLVRLRRMVGAA